MNMQALVREAQKMQKELLATQKEIEENIYEGKSEFVVITINGKYEVKSVKILQEEDLKADEKEYMEDMILLAFNDAVKKLNMEKEKKLSKYGNGLSGLL